MDKPPADIDPHDARMGRMLNDLFDRRMRGEAAFTPDTRTGPSAAELHDCLNVVQNLRPAAECVEDLITQGVLNKSDDPHYPAELGPYRIIGYLGRGGMGVVLKAFEESLNRSVALKILRPDLAHDANALTRFEREAKAAAALNHPNIVTVHAVGQHHGVHYIAMEYVDGPSLAEVIRSEPSACSAGPPSPATTLGSDTIREIFRQLLSALAAAHEAGLIHRDVKSSNILLASSSQPSALSPQPETTEGARPAADAPPCHVVTLSPCHPAGGAPPAVKLADFGLARVVTATTRVTVGDSILGTPEYMSPEQARGDENIDHRTDLYSASVVLYEMLTGRTPFQADTPTGTIHQILHDAPPDPRKLNDNVDPNLSSLALRLMAKSPADRFPSASAALKALDRGERVRAPARRRRMRRHLAATLAGLVIVAAAVWLLYRPASPPVRGVSERAAVPVVTEVWAEKRDGQPTTTILATYGDEPMPKAFHKFPAEVGAANVATLVDLDGQGEKAVVAGLRKPLDGCNLFAFDARGDELWRLDVSNHASIEKWPDCGPPVPWACRQLVVANLDGRGGDELVAVTSDSDDYPTRISVIDPRDGAVGSTFWHMGQLDGIRVYEDFFGPGRPALVAWGVNNKLDGFDAPSGGSRPERPPGEDAPRTKYDQVTILMVLDPTRMGGVGPPRSKRKALQNIAPALPFAYAFLDMPPTGFSGTYVPEGRTQRRRPDASELGYIGGVRLVPRSGNDVTDMQMKVYVGRPPSVGAGAILTVDRNLRILHAAPTTGEIIGDKEAYWRARWHAIVQNGQYVDE